MKYLKENYNPKKEIGKYLSMLNYATQNDLKPIIFDFSKPDAINSWEKTSDEVHGGFTRCSLSQNAAKTALQFRGNISTQLPERKATINPALGPPLVLARSGYAGCRSFIPWQIRYGYFLHGYDGLEIVVRGDNRTYNVNLYPNSEDSSNLYALQFQLSDSSVWKPLTLRFKDFALVYNGKVVGESPLLYHKRVQAIGISIQDGLDGEFNLEMKSMSFVSLDGHYQTEKKSTGIAEYLANKS